jgi:hypothetical protein
MSMRLLSLLPCTSKKFFQRGRVAQRAHAHEALALVVLLAARTGVALAVPGASCGQCSGTLTASPL